MADVQTKHGHFKIANRLMEAIIEGGFGDRQLRVILVLMRLTYGWGNRSVQLTEFELAEYCGAVTGDSKRAGGSFRSDLAELIRQKVIIRIEAGGKRNLMTWAINKDYETWGRFSTAPAKLVAMWNPRPKSTEFDDTAIGEELARIQATPPTDDDADDESTDRPSSGPDNADERPGSGPPIESEGTGTGPQCGPVTGPAFEAKSLFGETYDSRKTRKDSSTSVVEVSLTAASIFSGSADPAAVAAGSANENGDEQPPEPTAESPGNEPETSEQSPDSGASPLSGNVSEKEELGEEREAPPSPATASTRARTDAESAAVQQYAIGMSTAANAAIKARWGEQLIPVNYATGLELAAELIEEQVPLELARHVITSVCASSNNAKPPKVLAYWRAPIEEAHRDAEQRQLNAADPGAKGHRGGPPTAMAAMVRVASGQRVSDDDMRIRNAEYDAARREAAFAWGKDPANAAEFQAISEAAVAKYAGLSENNFVTRAKAAAIIGGCAERVAFPDFETWLAQRAPAGVSSE